MFCVKWLAKLSVCIHTDILVVSELVVVVILSEWWLIYLSGGRCRPLWAHPWSCVLEDVESIEIPTVECPLQPQEMAILQTYTNPLADCTDFGVGLYIAT